MTCRIMLLVGLIVTLGFSVNTASAQNVFTACKAVKMKCDYNSRYELIDTVYTASGQMLFDKQSNSYTRAMKDEGVKSEPPRFYIGEPDQNAKLSRNILANRNLFKDGKLTTDAAKRWNMVK